ncbi:MAG TPA: redox-regulated ATPase YchF [Methanofastidiosum sp.]|nr:redox-regulated ATPase YchF [Methanofastidiosum sp.]
MDVGIVGKPNVGKSTFFNAVTLGGAEIANYPFTTIDSNMGATYVTYKCPCKELNIKCSPQNSKCIDGTRLVPLKIIDVAGLVKGAHSGRGLGNKFLNDLSRAETLIHVVDASGSTDIEGNPVLVGSHNPLEDIEFLEEEIDLWFFGILNDNWFRFARKVSSGHHDFSKIVAEQFTGIGISEINVINALRETKLDTEKCMHWKEDELLIFAKSLRRISKPITIVLNKVDIAPPENIKALKEKLGNVFTVSAEAELVLRKAAYAGLLKYVPSGASFEVTGNLNDKQKEALNRIKGFMEKNSGTGVQNAINEVVFNILGKIVVYPVEDESHMKDGKGNVLPDAYLMERGSTPRDLAFRIHTDIGKNFLYAVNARTKMRIKDDYELQNGDIIKIVSAAR